MTAINYRNVRLDEFDQVKKLFESFYGENFFIVEPSLYRWLHHDSPARHRHATDEEFTAFAAFDEDGRIVSCINYVPTDLWVGDQSVPTCWSVGWYVRDGYPGVAGLLLKRHIRRFAAYMSMGATNWVKQIYTSQFGFSYQHNIARALMVANAAECYKLLSLNPEPHEADKNTLEAWENLTTKAAADASMARIDKHDQLRSKYWQDLRGRLAASVSKTPETLNWRYRNNPFAEYDVISTDSDQTGGLAIFRREAIRDGGANVVRLLEFLPTQGHDITLTQSVARYLLESKACFLDFFCGNRKFVNALSKPFLQEADHHAFAFPRLFQPLEWRERYSINASFRFNAKIAKMPEINLEDVYFTKGDPIQDVVVNREYVTKVI